MGIKIRRLGKNIPTFTVHKSCHLWGPAFRKSRINPSRRGFPMKKSRLSILPLFILLLAGWGCRPTSISTSAFKVTAVENFLADIAQNIAGDRLTVNILIPYGIEPHEFEPAPRDMIAVSESQLLIVNGGGLEGWLEAGLKTVGGSRIVITASAGLVDRSNETGSDPHYWLDPVLVKTYAANILEGLIRLDPAGEDEYRRNASTYTAQLDELDSWVASRILQVPAAQRKLVSNHESLGYFADRYGFSVLGSIFPGISPDAQPTASQMAELIDKIRATGVHAIFLEEGANAQMAEQIAQETGCRVVTGLFTHSLTPPGGVASTYLEMMRYDVDLIVEALQ
jgi:ABC-type Zn uptake system ZnuABC Zn-binding protein ZnuA